jgi:glycosyltransferase involved in cell wall biosynthesis
MIKMAKKSILLVTTRSEGVSASEIRMRYFRRSLENHGYKVVNYEINLSGLNRYLSYFYRSPSGGLITASKDVDLILATSPTLINAILGYKTAKKMGLPLIVDIRDIWEEYAKTAHPLMYSIGVIKRIVAEYYKALNYASKIFVVTEPMKQYYEKILGFENKVIVISNGTDVNIIKCDARVKREEDLVCLVDLNRPYHNLEFLFAALKSNDLRLIVVGGGRYMTSMQRIARNLGIWDRVSFVGWVPYEKLAAYLCRAKVGVVGRPFIANIEYLYTIPVKTYDYLAAGLSVAGYGPGNSALEKFILENIVGAYVAQSNPKILSDQLVRLVREQDKYRERASSLAINFDRKKLAQKVVEIVNETLTEKP